MIWTRCKVQTLINEGCLTRTEEEVLRLWSKGETITKMALELHLSESTINRTIRKLKNKIKEIQLS